jgi:hypothetical protein
MYRHYVNRRGPTAFWLLDDTVPFQEHSGFGASGGKKSGTSDPTTSVPLVAGAAFSSVFKSTSVGQFACNLFKQGLENRPFALEAWILPIPKTTTGPQQILSHGTIFDGLSIEGKVIRFGTQYLTFGDAFCDYDLVEYKLAHVVGIHSGDENQLWVNGELVASVELTEDQKGDTYVAAANDTYLFSGYTTSTQELAMNGVAFYPTLSGDFIRQNYEAGIETIGQERVASQYDGTQFDLDAANGAVFMEQAWVEKEDFNEGYKQNVEYALDQVEPVYDVTTGLSEVGSWTVGIPLDAQEDSSIYGVMLSWSGKNITVESSVDGTTWVAATNGSLVSTITNGYNPTNKDLQIRVSFAAGLTEAYLESLTAIGFRNNSITNVSARTAIVSHPAVLRENFEPNLYRDDNGVSLKGGTLTIGTDTTPDPDIARTLELWIKPLSGTPTISVGGTKYRNGVADATLPVGQWSLIHYVAAADITTTITVTGDCIVGQATIYPTALTATEVAHIFKSYTGAAVSRFTDAALITVSEGAAPVKVYAHDWSIDGAG